MAIDYEALALKVRNGLVCYRAEDAATVLRDAFTAELAEVRAWEADKLCELTAKVCDRDRTIAERDAEIVELKKSVVTFCAPWAVQYSETFGLLKNHLHPVHFDLLQKCGARTDDFIRSGPSQALGDRHHD